MPRTATRLAVLIGVAAVAAALAAGAGGVLAGGTAGLQAAMGKALFKRIWLPAPSSTKANDGLGPLFNARSCVQCHAAATAGRLETTTQGELVERGAVVRLSTSQGVADPVYGAQVQTRAIPGHTPEAAVFLDWDYSKVALADGTIVDLRKPGVRLTNAASGGLASGVTASLLLAPSLAIAAQIAKVDGDVVRRQRNEQTPATDTALPSFFGRKMSEASLETAISTAFSRDLGLSTVQHPGPAGDCTSKQAACMAGPHGDDGTGIEIAPEIVTAVSAYVASLSLSAPSGRARAADTQGQRLFVDAHCSGCHAAVLPGKNGSPVTLYSDLQLHDMGEGLAGVASPDGAKGSEWRTAPLLVIAERLAVGATLLHDGRARSVSEAILWHDGGARTSREAYERLSAAERAALEAYITSR